MKWFHVLLFIVVSNCLYAQTTTLSFAVPRHTFEFTKISQPGGTVKICVNAVGASLDPAVTVASTTECEYLNALDKPIFVNKVIELVRKLTDSAFVATHDSMLQKTLEAKFDSMQLKEKAEEIQFGTDEYFGLTEAEIATVLEKKKLLREKQILYRTQRKIRNTSDSKYVNLTANNDAQKLQARYDGPKTESQDSLEKNVLMNGLLAEIRILKSEIQAITERRKFKASLIGNANVVSSFRNADPTQINAGFGIRGHKPNHSEFIGIITVAQVNDTITGSTIQDFGTSLLVPGVRRFSLLTSYRLTRISPLTGRWFWKTLGFAMNVNVTPYNWAIRKADNSADSITGKAVPTAVDVMLPINWLNIYEEGKDVLISTDIGLSLRHVAGNLNGEKRKSFLGTSRQTYAGLILGLNIRYNGLRAQFHAPILFGSRVDGLTGGQVFASIGIISNIIGDESAIFKKKQ